MADLIKRQDAIDAAYQYISQFDAIDANFLDGLKEAINIVKKLPSAQPTHTAHSNTLDALDCISRQAAIDACLNGCCACVSDCVDEIEKLPSAEPVIIRCKDCKWCSEHYDTDGNAPYWTCRNWDGGTDADGFCYYAERRTDG